VSVATPLRQTGLLLALLLACPLPVRAQEAASEEPVAEEAAPGAEAPGEEAPPPLMRRPGFERPGERRTAPGTDAGMRARAPREVPPPLERPEYSWVAVPDRWRIVEEVGVNEHWYDPYHQSTLKGDRPILGTQDWFFRLDLLSDSTFEPRNIPVPAGIAVTSNDSDTDNDIFGDGNQLIFFQNWIASLSFIKGDTAFRPPDWEFRITGAANINQVWAQEAGILQQDPSKGKERFDWQIGLLEAFVDKHLWNKDDRYDFDSLRVGVQNFITDFRGFLYLDNNPGVRLFGNFFNNRLQYNLAWFVRLEKDTNSGIPRDFDLRDDNVFFANAYYQDFPVLGFTTQLIGAYNRSRDGDAAVHTNTNGFRERPAQVGDGRPTNYDIGYIGLNGDGHIDRFNLTYSVYYAFGHQDHNPIAQRDVDVSALLVAAEGSLDFDWYRLKLFGLYQSGDNNPYDSEANGFDAIFENPNFAGAATSYWVRQNLPCIFCGSVVLSGRNAILNTLRSSKEEGQSNFVNPGLGLVGVGADFDVLPQLRLIANASWLNFAQTQVFDALRIQPSVSNEIGWDLSAAAIYRPLFIENIVFNLSFAALIPGTGFRDLYPNDFYYSALFNMVLRY
jgi:hypothetical protein